MGALLPTIQANHLREGLTDYLATTFALTDPDAQSALSDFVGHPDTGMFKGPYVRLRLPFAPAGGNWSMHLDCGRRDSYPMATKAPRSNASQPSSTIDRSPRSSPPAPARARPRHSSTRSSSTSCARRPRASPDEGTHPLPDERARQRPGGAPRASHH